MSLDSVAYVKTGKGCPTCLSNIPNHVVISEYFRDIFWNVFITFGTVLDDLSQC